jgi:hypothetical protein
VTKRVPIVTADSQGADEALDLIRRLAVDVGPRRPCSHEEKRAAQLLERWLDERRVAAECEHFDGYASFGYPYALIMGAALAGGLLQRRGRRLGDVLAAASLAVAALEGDLRVTPLSDLLSSAGRVSTSSERSMRPVKAVKPSASAPIWIRHGPA